ncbi:DUF397 domain-containing protein [Actinomadura opuntiae]|uniref:DUF397 domain-containing protein n=1 Tax=Actinomadura sp. OS1-43 TaxID=604315 RepID=UPI00255AD0F2|nr:DUF397 domain-containing protein [Actinomadura sp. OS1-43]MDL4813561.1 DUF397 domain-containing protein [Actinomadura sp. OS1-43]
MPRPIPADLQWHTSTYTGSGGNCIEIACRDEAVYVRDSKNRSGPVLVITRADWWYLLHAIRCR